MTISFGSSVLAGMRLARVARLLIGIAVLNGACTSKRELPFTVEAIGPGIPAGLTARLVGVDTVVGIAVGQRLPPVLQVFDSAGAVVPNGLAKLVIAYRSSDPGVATIDGSGSVVGVGPGLTTISASVDDVHYTGSLRVHARAEHGAATTRPAVSAVGTVSNPAPSLLAP